MATDRRGEANRANSARSTGPKNTDRSRLNAIRHGILSSEAVIRDREGVEDSKLFEGLRDGLYESLVPVGELEGLLVDELVLLAWRRRRVVRFETAAIRENTDKALRNRNLHPVREVSETRSFDHVNVEDALAEYITLIQAVRDKPEPDDTIVAAAWVLLFEFVDKEFDSSVESVLQIGEDWGEKSHFPTADVAKLIRIVVANSGIELPEFWAKYEADLDLKIIELAMQVASSADAVSYDLQLASLPSTQAMEKVQRYEAHLSRLFYRALHELQHLQAIRISGTSIVVSDAHEETRRL